MNIMLQIAGLFVMIVIFIFYFIDRKGAVKSNKIFLYQSIAIFISLVIDIISIVLINTNTDAYITELMCRTYLPIVMTVACLGLCYVLNDISTLKRRFVKTIEAISFAIVILGFVLSFTTNLEIHHDPDGLNDYTAGIPVIITYVETFSFMTITVILAIVNRKKMYKKRVMAVMIFVGAWSLGAIIQGFINYVLKAGVTVLCVSFAETLGAIVIYIMLENPALNFDKVTGALTQRALSEYADNCYRKNKKIEFILIDFDNKIVSATIGYNNFLKSLTEMLVEFNVHKIFINDKNNLVVARNVHETKSLLENIMDFKEHLYLKNNIVVEIPFKIIHFKDISLFYDASDFMDVMEYIENNTNKYDKQLIDVNFEVVKSIHEQFILDKRCDVAFSKKKINVYYQPIYSNIDSSFIAAEALVRLIDEDGNLIYPDSFISEMEKDGRIIELGKIVFEEVCKFISENDMEQLKLHYIEVNLSAVQCMQEDLASSYINIMEKYHINPKYINLEITETAQSTRFTLLKNMNLLKEYGVSFSLDDFGTGNSNLNYIVEMPIEIVKFDKSMVTSYFENRIATHVMNYTIKMIKGLGHKIVFEGVENDEQINKAENLKIDYIQGYFYSKPINKDEFVLFIKNSLE